MAVPNRAVTNMRRSITDDANANTQANRWLMKIRPLFRRPDCVVYFGRSATNCRINIVVRRAADADTPIGNE
jgi:hypothetical protein